MTWYLFAYLAFWAALFGYLLGLSSRQARLNRRAAELTGRLIARSTQAKAPTRLPDLLVIDLLSPLCPVRSWQARPAP